MDVTQILVIEDNPLDVTLLRHGLDSVEDWPIQISVAADGEQATNYLLDPDKPKPDLVILDLNLPKRNGVEVLKIIRITDFLYGMPVIVLSGTPEPEARAKMKRAKLDAELYLTKPSSVAGFNEIALQLRDFCQQFNA